ncbi:MAG: hypothetical protein U5Q16_01945 [Gammaproteobacteria bacterium]|nr:hypothetical protein [Gammaproteobacteria bacterium]
MLDFSTNELFMLTDSVVLSAVIWAAIVMTVMYLGRAQAHQSITTLARMLHNVLRLAAFGLRRAEQHLETRNREVLLAAGREAKERIVTREFERINATVERDLARYPETQRTLSETIQRIDDDHQSTAEVPPQVPGWSRAVKAVADAADKSDPSVRDVLEAIHESLERAQARSLTAYREASRQRHRLLSRMMPRWRSIQSTLQRMDGAVASILERSRSIDRHMDEYRDIVAGTDRAVQNLSTSALVQFAVATLVILVAIGGAVINFSLIARPMAEMVGGTSYIGAFQTADIAALVIILVEITMGLFLMESLRITRLFPVIAALPDRTRVYMCVFTLTILTILASVEAGLAYMREILLQDELATAALLRGEGAAAMTSEALWITTAAQMGMGFILPFALVFVAIPLETFVQTLRHVLGMVAILVLRLANLVLRIAGQTVRQTGVLLQHLYDVVIFAPLWAAARLAEAGQRRATRSPREAVL